MLTPSFGAAVTNPARTLDRRTMTRPAAAGAPFTPFIGSVPAPEPDRKPLMYAKPRTGLRVYSHTGKGEIPGEKAPQHTLNVNFPETQGEKKGTER